MRPFSCGSQFDDWTASNCDECTRSGSCDIEAALQVAYFGDGEVSDGTAERMGALDHAPPRSDGFFYGWPCPEHQPAFENHHRHCANCAERSLSASTPTKGEG